MRTDLLLLISAVWLGQADFVEAALADRARLPATVQARYLVLSEGKDWKQVLDGHCNQLSRASDITRLELVAPRLVRLTLDDYLWSHDLWESLGNADPWYHLLIEVEEIHPWPGGVWPADGKYYAPGAFKYHTKVKKANALAPWLGPSGAKLGVLCGSQSPILRADWFFNQTAAQVDRKPGYYDFLGVKDEATFQALVGFDPKKERRRVEVREATSHSGVTLEEVDRAVSREDGGYWRSFDFNTKKLQDANANPLVNFGRDIEEAFRKAPPLTVASEQYGQLPNFFWATFLGNEKGVRQDIAPDFIATDGRSKTNDRRVHANVSCMRCHTDGGLQDFDQYVRNLIAPPLGLQTPDYERYRLLRQQYVVNLQKYLKKDREAYAEAVMEATGWDTKVYAQKYAAAWEYYEDARVDSVWAARDCNLTEKEFVTSLCAYLRVTKILDPLLAVFLQGSFDRGVFRQKQQQFWERRTISIRQWEQTFPKAMTILAGVKR